MRAFRLNLLQSKEGGPFSTRLRTRQTWRSYGRPDAPARVGGAVTGRLRAPTGRYGGKTAEERQAARPRRSLDAPPQLFGDTPGYRATTVAALSEAAGLSTRQFYEEFRTLEDVLAALHLEVNDWAEQAVLEALAEAEPLPLAQRVTVLFRAYARDVTSDPRRIRIPFVEIIGVSPRLEEQRLARRAGWVDLIC